MTSLPVQDDPSAADQARARLQKKRSPFHLLLKLRSKAKGKQRDSSIQSFENVAPASSGQELTVTGEDIRLSCSVEDAEEGAEYQWVSLYENQRGLTLFSTPYYSKLSLLPHDPSPFTIPNTSRSCSQQPNVSIDVYPLPDGNWRWVSKSWMIDMRSNTGEVQHDGFEYNWVFRSKHWRPKVGPLSAGGWVRRRRWVRLMMRPAKPKPKDDPLMITPIEPSMSSVFHFPYLKRNSIASSIFPPSILSKTDLHAIDVDEVWQGELEADWARYRLVMKLFTADGRKLEVWRRWLGMEHLNYRRPRKQWTEDDTESLPSEGAPDDDGTEGSESVRNTTSVVDHIAQVVNKYGEEILRSFIYPDTRAHLIELWGVTNVVLDLGSSSIRPGIDWFRQVDFHSYASGLANLTLDSSSS